MGTQHALAKRNGRGPTPAPPGFPSFQLNQACISYIRLLRTDDDQTSLKASLSTLILHLLPLIMPPSSRSPTPPSTRRLLQELKTTLSEPSPILHSLGPISDDQMLHWEAVMKGVPGTAYEGKIIPSSLWAFSLLPAQINNKKL